jgi:menaquinone-dependent protoporphyrinogen oxidase
MPVLVGYASQHGSTRGIAEQVAARLGEHGIHVEVRPLDRVTDVGGYDAFVIGSAIHNQAWLPEATAFLRRNLNALAGQPVWLFSVGMPAALRGPFRALAGKQGPQLVAGFREAIHPRDHHVFSGVIQPDHLSRTGRLLFKVFASRYGDFRDWHEIDAWAESIVRELAGGTPPPSPATCQMTADPPGVYRAGAPHPDEASPSVLFRPLGPSPAHQSRPRPAVGAFARRRERPPVLASKGHS